MDLCKGPPTLATHYLGPGNTHSVNLAHENVHLIASIKVAGPQDSGCGSLLQFWEKQNQHPTMDSIIGQKISSKVSQEISECNNAWILYLQSLSGLCTAGARVSQSLQQLAKGLPVSITARQCRMAWDDLLRATQAASISVRVEVAAALREISLEEQSSHNNEEIVSSNLATLINLQYQFCVACCECLGNVGAQSQPETIPQQAPPQPSPSAENTGGLQIFPRLQQGGQRRWSEVAARRPMDKEDNREDSGAPRRWSVPWEGPGAGGSGAGMHKLAVPLVAHERSSRSTTPDSASLASQEELQEVISLLSCKPNVQHNPPNRQLPGVTLTSCSLSEGREMWSPGVPLFPRDGGHPCVSWQLSQGISEGTHNEASSSQINPRRGSSPRPSQHVRSRTGWPTHELLYNTIWGENDGEQTASSSSSHLELFPPNQSDNSHSYTSQSDNSHSYQRKSSSSTDSSSSSSLPQPSMPEAQPSHLYSMWSGSEMTPSLPFLQLPTSPTSHSNQEATHQRP